MIETITIIKKGEKQNMENRVYLYGLVVSNPKTCDDYYGSDYCNMDLSVQRLSGIVDTIPLTIHRKLIEKHKIKLGDNLAVLGEFRSYNKIENNRSRLMLTMFVHEVTDDIDVANPNIIELSGYVCKLPVYRTTPFNREIADLLIACNRSGNKSDYLPAIAWGRNARFAKNITVGEQIHISGRLQSREYQKRLDDGTVQTRTAYEISINQIDCENANAQNGDTNFILNNL